jgi:hypothetical protein
LFRLLEPQSTWIDRLNIGLWLSIRRAKKKIEASLRKRYPSLTLDSFGATDISPRYLAVWVITSTDAERDDLARDPALVEMMRHEFLTAGYPSEYVPSIGFGFESQETVDRDFGGSWYHAMK